MMHNDDFFIKRAIELGREAMNSNAGGPFGALVVINNEIISEGKNEVTSKNDPTSHAEINAIRLACQKLNTFTLPNATLYTSCEPCPMCLGAIYWARIKRLIFANNRIEASEIAGFDDNIFYREISLPWNEKKIEYKEMGKSEGIKLFREWKAREDKTMY